MYEAIAWTVQILKHIVPGAVVTALRTPYHFLLSLISAVAYGFPARHMVVVGVNGTKGKSTTSEMLYAIFRKAGYTTALASTIRFAVNEDSTPNRFKMTMAGRGFLQKFLAEARTKGATHAVVELTSEGARESRHRFLSLDALIMLNVQKEHIESFGSLRGYVAAKWWLVHELMRSKKERRAVIASTDDTENARFLSANVPVQIPFSKNDLTEVTSTDSAVTFTYKNIAFSVPLPGTFNATNALAAIKTAEHLGISLETARDALETMPQVAGRLEPIECGQPFRAIVDYAHTPDSLEALYGAYPQARKICVLGNTGGGRDTWKRPLMGAIADSHCFTVILTNEDPYDEDPQKIVNDMTTNMKRKPRIIMDRREAIRTALSLAEPGDVVLISGKGTDPFIMGPKGEKTPWSDAEVVREELENLGFRK